MSFRMSFKRQYVFRLVAGRFPRKVYFTCFPQGKQWVILCEGDTANSPDEVPLHERTQHGKQTGRAGRYCAARKLRSNALTETWWDESHEWSMAIDGYRLFRRDRWGKRGGGIALYIKKSIQCEELSLKNSHEQLESLWIRIRDRGNK